MLNLLSESEYPCVFHFATLAWCEGLDSNQQLWGFF